MKTETRKAQCRLDSAWKKDAATGYLDSGVNPTKAGVFLYANRDGSTRRELRPRNEVFDAESLQSLVNKPFTNSHPPTLLNVINTQKYQTGTVYGEHKQDADGIHTVTRVQVTDAQNIRDIESGKVQVSCGYTCDMDETPGVDPEFGPYDAIQRNIRYNHLASEWRGRAGSGARLRADADDNTRFDAWEIPDDTPETDPQIQDTKKKESKMDKIRIDGKEYSAEAAQVALDHKIKADAQALETAKAEADTQSARADKAEASRDELQAKLDAANAQIKELESQDITAMVKARASLESTAGRIVTDAKFDGLSDREIKELVIKARHDWADVNGRSDDYVNALYESAVKADAKRDPVLDRLDAAPDSKEEKTDAAKNLESAYSGLRQRMTDGWKKTAKAGKN